MNPNPSLDYTSVAKLSFVLLTLFTATKKRICRISHRKYRIKNQYGTAKGTLKTVYLQRKFCVGVCHAS